MSNEGTVFVRKDADGNEIERIAYTPTDLVKFRFDGWSEKAKPAKKAAAAKPDKAEKAEKAAPAAADDKPTTK